MRLPASSLSLYCPFNWPCRRRAGWGCPPPACPCTVPLTDLAGTGLDEAARIHPVRIIADPTLQSTAADIKKTVINDRVSGQLLKGIESRNFQLPFRFKRFYLGRIWTACSYVAPLKFLSINRGRKSRDTFPVMLIRYRRAIGRSNLLLMRSEYVFYLPVWQVGARGGGVSGHRRPFSSFLQLYPERFKNILSINSSPQKEWYRYLFVHPLTPLTYYFASIFCTTK